MTEMIFDIEADGFLEDASVIHCISISVEGDKPKCYTDVDKAVRALEWATTLVGHNIINYDLPVLKKIAGWTPKQTQKIYDTFPISKIVWPDITDKDKKLDIPKKYWGKYGLRAFGYRLNVHKGEIEDFRTYSEEMGRYCDNDVKITGLLYSAIKHKDPNGTGQGDSFALELRFAEVAYEMEQVGIHFNMDEAIKLYLKLERDRSAYLSQVSDLVPPTVVELKSPEYWIDPVTECKYRIKSEAPQAVRKELERGPNRKKVTSFNPMSRTQVADFLISRGWEPDATTPTGKPKVDEGTLLKIEDIPEAAVLSNLYRVQKMIAMLAEGKEAWIKLAKGDRIHPHLNTIGAVSGRTSCVRPNLQQVPSARLPYGKECRQLFGSPTGYSMISCDAKSLEVRCFAHYMARYDSGEFAEEVLLADIHQANADLMNCDRQTAKNVFFAVIYGASPKKVASMLCVEEEYAAELIDRLFSSRPAMGHLITGIKRTSSTRRYLRGLDGRKLIPRSEHSSVNLLIQAAGACVSKQAAINLYDDIVTNRMGCHGVKIVGFIHDELLLEAIPDMAEVVLDLAVHAFRKTTDQFSLRCAMDGEGSIGDNWDEVH